MHKTLGPRFKVRLINPNLFLYMNKLKHIEIKLSAQTCLVNGKTRFQILLISLAPKAG